MTGSETREADLAAIASAYELNHAIASHFPDDPVVTAAEAHCKATYAAFLAAVSEADAARGFRRIRAFRHVRQTCAVADAAQAALRVAVEHAERNR